MTTVIAFGTNRQAYYDLFMESCRRYNINPVIIGWNEKWIGYGKKTMEICDYIKNLDKDEIVISVDPFDVIFLSGLDEIEKKFRESSSKFLCGAMRLGPIMGYIYNSEFNKTGKTMPDTPTKYNYLNTGTWIARAGYAVEFINMLAGKYGMTDQDMDQEIITGIYINDRPKADIDWKCNIFHNLLFTDFVTRKPDLKDLEFRDGRLFNTATGVYPSLLHASGNTLMQEIASKLGYDKKFAVPVHNNVNFLKKALFHISQLFWVILCIISFAASMIFVIIYLFK